VQARAGDLGGVRGCAGGGVEVGVVGGGGAGACCAVLGAVSWGLRWWRGKGGRTGAVELSSVREGVS
jgi:hypothetical protein